MVLESKGVFLDINFICPVSLFPSPGVSSQLTQSKRTNESLGLPARIKKHGEQVTQLLGRRCL